MFQQLEFFPSIPQLIDIIDKHPPSLFLDSSMTGHHKSRYSYALLSPTKVWCEENNPWSWLKLEMAGPPVDGPFPFSGGIAGYLGYECAFFLEPYTHLPKKTGPIPPYWFARFDCVLVLDHQKNEAWLAFEADSNAKALWIDLLKQKNHEIKSARGSFRHQPDFKSYQSHIKKIHDYLAAGDIYQVNLTQRFEAHYAGPPGALYQALRRESPAPFAAFLNAGDFAVLSASPECLLEFSPTQVATYPIKGTRPRHADPAQDTRLKTELMNSEKDAAELLMIVDLERNDLGQVCEFGSVTVKNLGTTDSFAQVHHRVAEVVGKPRAGITARDALAAVFPGGSVTGAPKKRAMEIIAELEETPRSVYTGALGYFGNNGQAHFNLPIRTMIKKGDQVFFNAGGGIVADSEAQKEFEELLTKASGMVKALTS